MWGKGTNEAAKCCMQAPAQRLRQEHRVSFSPAWKKERNSYSVNSGTTRLDPSAVWFEFFHYPFRFIVRDPQWYIGWWLSSDNWCTTRSPTKSTKDRGPPKTQTAGSLDAERDSPTRVAQLSKHNDCQKATEFYQVDGSLLVTTTILPTVLTYSPPIYTIQYPSYTCDKYKNRLWLRMRSSGLLINWKWDSV